MKKSTLRGIIISSVVLVSIIVTTVVNACDKIWICHVPPGNPNNKQALYVDANSWDGHKNHSGDFIIDGKNDPRCKNESPTNTTVPTKIIPTNTTEPTKIVEPTNTPEATKTVIITETEKPIKNKKTKTPEPVTYVTPTISVECMSECEFRETVVDLLRRILVELQYMNIKSD